MHTAGLSLFSCFRSWREQGEEVALHFLIFGHLVESDHGVNLLPVRMPVEAASVVASFLLLNPGQGVATAAGSWLHVSAGGAGGALSTERCPDSSWRNKPRREEVALTSGCQVCLREWKGPPPSWMTC